MKINPLSNDYRGGLRCKGNLKIMSAVLLSQQKKKQITLSHNVLMFKRHVNNVSQLLIAF